MRVARSRAAPSSSPRFVPAIVAVSSISGPAASGAAARPASARVGLGLGGRTAVASLPAVTTFPCSSTWAWCPRRSAVCVACSSASGSRLQRLPLSRQKALLAQPTRHPAFQLRRQVRQLRVCRPAHAQEDGLGTGARLEIDAARGETYSDRPPQCAAHSAQHSAQHTAPGLCRALGGPARAMWLDFPVDPARARVAPPLRYGFPTAQPRRIRP